MERRRLAFVGLGVMGRSMVGHLLAAGREVMAHTRTPATAAELPGLALAQRSYEALAEVGGSEHGTQALLARYL